MHRLTPLLFTGALVCCFSTVAKQEYLQRNVAPRAAFDLQCPQNQITFTDLGPPADDLWADGPATAVRVEQLSNTQGASGCGKRATYVYADGKWVMNTEQAPEKK